MATLKDLTVLGPARFLDKTYGNLEGNAATASKLSPGATINGTTFTGSANITTTKWGYSRTLTVGTDSSGSYSRYYMRMSSATLTIEYAEGSALQYYDGSAWKQCISKYWDGSAWKQV